MESSAGPSNQLFEGIWELILKIPGNSSAPLRVAAKQSEKTAYKSVFEYPDNLINYLIMAAIWLYMGRPAGFNRSGAINDRISCYKSQFFQDGLVERLSSGYDYYKGREVLYYKILITVFLRFKPAGQFSVRHAVIMGNRCRLTGTAQSKPIAEN